jgi:hypothetical protein
MTAPVAQIGEGDRWLKVSADGDRLRLEFKAGGLSGRWISEPVNRAAFAGELQRLYETLAGEVTFSDEDSFGIEITAGSGGRLAAKLQIIPSWAFDGVEGDLHLAFEFDQTYLPPLIKSLRAATGTPAEEIS